MCIVKLCVLYIINCFTINKTTDKPKTLFYRQIDAIEKRKKEIATIMAHLRHLCLLVIKGQSFNSKINHLYFLTHRKQYTYINLVIHGHLTFYSFLSLLLLVRYVCIKLRSINYVNSKFLKYVLQMIAKKSSS